MHTKVFLFKLPHTSVLKIRTLPQKATGAMLYMEVFQQVCKHV